tara:strand:- start:1821 stop:2369 length:549 start_codon:yes stop_codon:yes gene_type:complete
MSLVYSLALVFHIIGVAVAVGSATIVDYLHVIGLRRSSLEKGLCKIYPKISILINLALILIYLSGFVLVYQKPELLESNLFMLKVLLVIIVTINGLYLQKIISPELDKCVLKGNKYCTSFVLYGSAVSGSISIVTWYSVLILSLTKNLGYSLQQFFVSYLIVLIVVIGIVSFVERSARRWRI